MHSDRGSHMPVFRDDVIVVKPNLGAIRVEDAINVYS